MLSVTIRYIFDESRAASSAKRLQTMVKRLLFRPFPQIFLLIKHLFPVMYLPLSIGSELTMIGTHIENFRVIKFFWVGLRSEKTPCYHVHRISCQSLSLQSSAESFSSWLPMFINNFSSTFPLHLINSSMVWYFQNNSESLINEVLLQ